MKLICVDNGYGKTKVKTNNSLYMFDSKIQLALNNENVLQIDGINYQIGVGQDDIGMDKSISEVHHLCLFKALAENIQEDEELKVILDLPLTHYYNLDYRQEFKDSISKNKNVTYNGIEKNILIKEIEVCPQGLSSIYAYNHNQYKDKILGIIDIGALTIDGCIVDNLKPIKESIFSINLGTLILENKIKTALNQQFMLNIQDYQMPYIIREGLSNIPDANIVINNVIQEYFNQLKREMLAKNWSIETLQILGIGGGALLLNDLLELNFNYIQSPNPLYDNVLGLWQIGQSL